MDVRHVRRAPGWPARGVPGALLSLGDTHAAMGDGEVCGTGVETSSVVQLRVGLEKDNAVPTAVLERTVARRAPVRRW